MNAFRGERASAAHQQPRYPIIWPQIYDSCLYSHNIWFGVVKYHFRYAKYDSNWIEKRRTRPV